ncbi:MAG: hypothetical protein ACE5GS_00615 [Kiloniellaceae bacterium]
MVASRPDTGRQPRQRITLWIFLVCFGVFGLNVLLGKAAITFGWEEIPLLGDIEEFLLLLFAVALFVIATLQRERARDHPIENASGRPDRNKGGTT